MFRWVQYPAATRGHPCALLHPGGALPTILLLVIYDTSSIREPSTAHCLKCGKLVEKRFIEPKTNEIWSNFVIF
jgi:hypothetical protein